MIESVVFFSPNFLSRMASHDEMGQLNLTKISYAIVFHFKRMMVKKTKEKNICP